MTARGEAVRITSDADIVVCRELVRDVAASEGLRLVEQTRLVTAASELARNALEHGGGGTLRVRVEAAEGRRGIRLVVRDAGPGIADVPMAMTDGYTTGHGLGLGLGGVRRLLGDVVVRSAEGHGTTVVATYWHRTGWAQP